LKALQSIEDKCYKRDEIIILWTCSPAYDILNNIEWKNTSHNVRASSNNATRDVHQLIKYYQDNGWNLKVNVQQLIDTLEVTDCSLFLNWISM